MPHPDPPPADPCFVAVVHYERTSFVVGVWSGSSPACQHVEKLVHNDYHMGLHKIRSAYVRRFERDHPNPDPASMGEMELVHSRVIPSYEPGDPCPCAYCVNTTARGQVGPHAACPFEDTPTRNPEDVPPADPPLAVCDSAMSSSAFAPRSLPQDTPPEPRPNDSDELLLELCDCE